MDQKLAPDLLDSLPTDQRSSKNFFSFDGTTKVQGQLVEPENINGLEAILRLGHAPMIPRGQGVSYALASGLENGLAVDMRKLNRVLNFDQENLEITVQAGIGLGSLLSYLVPRGYYFPVLPGHPRITVGGCIGFNVHGKSEFHTGLFGDWVREFVLIHPDHGMIRASRLINQEIFELTLGGFGLTGFIVEVTLKVTSLPGKRVAQQAINVANWSEAVAVMQNHEGKNPQIYSWHHLSKGNSSGKGVVFVDTFVDLKDDLKNKQTYDDARNFVQGKIHGNIGGKMLWRLGAKVLPRMVSPVYGLMQAMAPPIRNFTIMEAAFPLNGKEIYFKSFGQYGFREYQFIVDLARWPECSKRLEVLLASLKLPITLASLKLFSGKKTLLNFIGDGVCLALDVPNWPGSRQWMDELDKLVIACGGVANIAKDSRISSESIQKMYQDQYSQFKDRLLRFDPKARMQSELRIRLGC